MFCGGMFGIKESMNFKLLNFRQILYRNVIAKQTNNENDKQMNL
jgi:hypothetical protein